MYRFRKVARTNPAPLRFIEQDRGLVHLVSMPFIPQELRLASQRSQMAEWVPKDFITEEQCGKEAKNGIAQVGKC